jgi:hypothetical protein
MIIKEYVEVLDKICGNYEEKITPKTLFLTIIWDEILIFRKGEKNEPYDGADAQEGQSDAAGGIAQ